MAYEDNRYPKGHYNDADHPEDLINDDQENEQPVGSTPTTNHLPGGSSAVIAGDEDSYTETGRKMIQDLIDGVKPESEEARKMREKLERSQGVINGIADMGRALANLYFTSQYAPNAYDDTKSLSAAHQKRVKEAAEEREKKRKEYYNYAIAMNKLDEGERDFNFKQSVTAERLRQGSERLQLQIEQAAAKASNNERRLALQEGRLALDQQRAELEAQYKNRLISIQQYKAETQRLNQIEHKLQEYTTTTTIERDANGRETGRTTQRVVNGQGVGGKGTGYGSGGDNQGKGRGY